MGTDSLFSVEASPEVLSIGCLDEAKEVVYRTYRSSKAYRDFVAAAAAIKTEQDIRALPWEQIPITSKETLYEAADFADLMPAENASNISSYLRSSGSSRAVFGGKGFFWPQLRESVNLSMQQWKGRVVDIFQLEHRKTLAIIGMGLGSWSGGDRYNLMLKSLALEKTYPLTAFSPGTALPEIVEIIDRFGSLYNQILIVIVPTLIFHLEKVAKQANLPLPYHKLAFITPGECFHEDLRKHVQQQALPQKMTFISNYASADAELSGLESPELVEVRQVLDENPGYADAIGFKSRSIPNMFHAFTSAGYLENVDGRMTITRWQGLPLARYDLHDSVQFFRWRALCAGLAKLTGNQEKWLAHSQRPYTDVIAVFGRADQCVVLFGDNLYGTMLEEVLMRSTLGPSSTGHFVVWPTHIGGRQTLNWQIELKKGVALSDEQIDQHYASLIARLAEQQSGFSDNLKLFSPEEKIFNLYFCNEPDLVGNPRYRPGIKKRVVIPTGPL
jgi:phenylacetate-coenzyme A ligase PaaK-like adenylate-forming protein